MTFCEVACEEVVERLTVIRKADIAVGNGHIEAGLREPFPPRLDPCRLERGGIVELLSASMDEYEP